MTFVEHFQAGCFPHRCNKISWRLVDEEVCNRKESSKRNYWERQVGMFVLSVLEIISLLLMVISYKLSGLRHVPNPTVRTVSTVSSGEPSSDRTHLYCRSLFPVLSTWRQLQMTHAFICVSNLFIEDRLISQLYSWFKILICTSYYVWQHKKIDTKIQRNTRNQRLHSTFSIWKIILQKSSTVLRSTEQDKRIKDHSFTFNQSSHRSIITLRGGTEE